MNKNIAVVGCGHWGKNLVRNFSELDVLAAVCDPNLEISQKYSSLYSVRNLSFSEILDDASIEGVVLAVPAPLHSSLARKAFTAGKHVFVEKPLAMTLEEADQMIEASEKTDRHLMVGHLLQYHPIFIRLKELIAKGDLGSLKYISSSRLSFGKIRSEEDVLWSFAPHDISMILKLANQGVADVRCEAVEMLQAGIADQAHLHILFEDGLRGYIHCSWLHPKKEQKLIVVGSEGMAVFDDVKPWNQKLALFAHKVDWAEASLELIKADATYEEVNFVEPLKNECQYFIKLISGQVEPMTSGYEGREVLEILTSATACIETMRSKHA